MRSLEHTLTALMALPIDQRVFVVNTVEHRADDIQFDSATGFWYINVVKKRAGHGPGKYAVGQTLQGFAFSSGEAFGEDTAALYNPVTRDMYIQYNHVGVRHTGLATYLSKAAGAEPYYRILPKLQRDAERRLQGQQVTRRVELGFDLTQMTAADYQAGNSLTQMAALGSDCDADKIYITMTISARDPRKRLDRRVKDSLLGMLTSSGLTKAKVVGGDEPPVQVVTTKRGKTKEIVGKGDFEPIDLIDGLMEAEFSIALGGDYRMPLVERYRALAVAQNKLR
ncbi:DUF6731 family protein [Stenotrophomonas geniculata]|uniref:DUF6731 family protein n=1 Tax=Stenotrophomonas geniculata TaxID=86188 RepID=UPI002E7AA200|nr:DUF6731 family protein [Stenotrophomonas geniculata]